MTIAYSHDRVEPASTVGKGKIRSLKPVRGSGAGAGFMAFGRLASALLVGGAMSALLPAGAAQASASEANITIAVPKQTSNKEFIQPVPQQQLVVPQKNKGKPKVEPIRRTQYKSDDWRTNIYDRIWSPKAGPLVVLNCMRDTIIAQTYNYGDVIGLIPRTSARLRPGQSTGKRLKCGTRRYKGQCSLWVGTHKDGFAGWSEAHANWGSIVLFGTAQHVAAYGFDPRYAKGCMAFKKYIRFSKWNFR